MAQRNQLKKTKTLPDFMASKKSIWSWSIPRKRLGGHLNWAMAPGSSLSRWRTPGSTSTLRTGPLGRLGSAGRVEALGGCSGDFMGYSWGHSGIMYHLNWEQKLDYKVLYIYNIYNIYIYNIYNIYILYTIYIYIHIYIYYIYNIYIYIIYNIYIYIYIYIYILYVCVYIYMYVCMYVCIYILYVCIYTYIDILIQHQKPKWLD